jgi:uncharacterized membrane protein
MANEPISDIIDRALTADFDMGWDWFLAAVPLVLAYVLFRRRVAHGPLAWIGITVFVLFLPNAAYPLTDLLHFVLKVRQRPYLPAWAIALIVIPQYVLFIGTSFLAYILSLKFVGEYLNGNGKARLAMPAEVSLHFLCALGIFLGRALRLNSWDALTHPEAVAKASALAFDRWKYALFVIGTSVIVGLLYYCGRFMVDAIQNRFRQASTLDELPALLRRAGFELGRDADGRLFLRQEIPHAVPLTLQPARQANAVINRFESVS